MRSVAFLAVLTFAGPASAQFYRIPGDGGGRFSQYPPGSPYYRYAYPGGNPYYPGPSLPTYGGFGPRLSSPPVPPPPAVARGRASVTVRLPAADAVLTVNGRVMKQSGRERTFVTPPLTPGRPAEYEFRAAWRIDGREVEMVRTVRVQDGAEAVVDFTAR